MKDKFNKILKDTLEYHEQVLEYNKLKEEKTDGKTQEQ